jgi:quercetin dioxygenase-like cupin family protein
MEYETLDTEDADVTDLSEVAEMNVAIWYFEPGEGIGYHAHAEQEELYYVLSGRFSLKLGRSGETETREVGPGAFWAAGPETGHGHRYLGDDRGAVLAIGAPPVEDPGMDPHEL